MWKKNGHHTKNKDMSTELTLVLPWYRKFCSWGAIAYGTTEPWTAPHYNTIRLLLTLLPGPVRNILDVILTQEFLCIQNNIFLA
jgi:hypothetical protein